jgi:c-di-AMP phosphodiesterase-like protein
MFYEDLVNQPEAELRKLCAFLEIDYDKNMLDFKHSANELIKESEVSWKKETLGPLLKKNTEKWKRELTNQQLFVIETICRKELKQWNYRFSDQHQRKSWKKFPQMVFLNILSIAFRLIYRFLT